MEEKKGCTPTWIKVFWFALATVIAVISGLYFVFGWIFALVVSIRLFLLYVPAIVAIAFYASVIYTLVVIEFDFEDWNFLWLKGSGNEE